MGDDSEWMKLPVDQKCEHKVNDLSLLRFNHLTCSEQMFVGFKSVLDVGTLSLET